jgi:hypothetical protein
VDARVTAVQALGAAMFAAFARNSGENPAEHFDRNAAEQWMAQALEECGVADMVAVLSMVRMLRQLGGMMPGSRDVVLATVDAADAALARAGGGK